MAGSVERRQGCSKSSTSESGTTVILAEQHAELALSMTQNVIVLERGTIVHSAKSVDMLKDTAAIDRYIGLRVAAVGSAART